MCFTASWKNPLAGSSAVLLTFQRTARPLVPEDCCHTNNIDSPQSFRFHKSCIHVFNFPFGRRLLAEFLRFFGVFDRIENIVVSCCVSYFKKNLPEDEVHKRYKFSLSRGTAVGVVGARDVKRNAAVWLDGKAELLIKVKVKMSLCTPFRHMV
jgi:hypothetical protein